ncbi:LysR substrate-binding domain-containing protein [Nocardia sp. NPDC051030]|uniref:LysR substrate-binding domain-containing protein n=1 Tax=Nocardia sp. NPDC051030 TaxID=3155162 RepID=UPI0034412C05
MTIGPAPALFDHAAHRRLGDQIGAAQGTPRGSTVPMLTELVVELISAGEGVGVLPSWVVAPFTARGEVSTVRIGPRGETRPWYAGTRPDEDRPHVLDFIALLHAHFAPALR